MRADTVIANTVPPHLGWLVLVYSVASLVHFTHNAEYIALYPNMPAWIAREDVYLAWLAVAAVGVAGGLMWAFGQRAAALVALGLYGAMGLYGLLHYTLALCSEHTLVMNLTIWFEAAAGSILALAAFRQVAKLRTARLRRS